MFKSLFALFFLTFTACEGHVHYVDGPFIEEPSYFSSDFAGKTFSATHVEFGLQTDNIYSVDPGSLQLYFDPFSNQISGNKNCNNFWAEAFILNDLIEISLIEVDLQPCPLEIEGFPEEISLEDRFYIETYSRHGRTFINLVSPAQDIVIYLE